MLVALHSCNNVSALSGCGVGMPNLLVEGRRPSIGVIRTKFPIPILRIYQTSVKVSELSV